MKRYFKSIILLLFFCNFKTQAQLKWGYKIGINNTGNISNRNDNLSYSNRLGLQGGIFAEAGLGKNFYFQPAAQLDYVGYGLNVITYNKLGLSISPNLIYKLNNFQIGLGPKFIAMLSSSPYPLSSDEKTDIGFNVLLGYSLNEKMSLQLNYAQNKQSYESLKRYTIGLSLLGYFGQ